MSQFGTPPHKIVELLDVLEVRARDIGWELQYQDRMNMSMEDVKFVLQQMKEQYLLYDRYLDIWYGDVPSWAQEMLQFPMDESWLQSTVAKVEFDQKWREIFQLEKLELAPSLRREFPVLPPLIESEDVSHLVSFLRAAKKQFHNRIWLCFRWLLPSFYSDRRASYRSQQKSLTDLRSCKRAWERKERKQGLQNQIMMRFPVCVSRCQLFCM